MGKNVKMDKSTPEKKAYWDRVEKIAKEVESWPEYKDRSSWLYKNYSTGDLK